MITGKTIFQIIFSHVIDESRETLKISEPQTEIAYKSPGPTAVTSIESAKSFKGERAVRRLAIRHSEIKMPGTMVENWSKQNDSPTIHCGVSLGKALLIR
jgi:hypothetical protein